MSAFAFLLFLLLFFPYLEVVIILSCCGSASTSIPPGRQFHPLRLNYLRNCSMNRKMTWCPKASSFVDSACLTSAGYVPVVQINGHWCALLYNATRGQKKSVLTDFGGKRNKNFDISETLFQKNPQKITATCIIPPRQHNNDTLEAPEACAAREFYEESCNFWGVEDLFPFYLNKEGINNPQKVYNSEKKTISNEEEKQQHRNAPPQTTEGVVDIHLKSAQEEKTNFFKNTLEKSLNECEKVVKIICNIHIWSLDNL